MSEARPHTSRREDNAPTMNHNRKVRAAEASLPGVNQATPRAGHERKRVTLPRNPRGAGARTKT